MWLEGFLVCVCAANVIADQWRIVDIDQGPVKGYRAPEGHFVYYEIPYATTPTGPNKFKPPLPPPTWTEPFEAVRKFVICPQNVPEQASHILNPQEDCLITNIYVPDTEETNLPVLVHFHGGAFQFGFGNQDTAINLLNTKKIIIVNFNYRLGAHGFLCLGTEDIPGNAAMKDQIALLRWVQRNIASFGGNPNDVTINGWSAGSSSVDLIMISKLGRGLFHKVIPESGANTASFSVQVDPIANAKMIAEKLNFNDVDNIASLEAFYKNVTFDKLYSLDVVNQPNSATIISPCIEYYVGQEIFLDDYPANILKSGNYPKVPMLYGIAEMEGIFRLPNFDKWKTMMNNKFSDFLPEDLSFERDEEEDYVSEQIKQFYFGNEPVSENNVLKFVQYFTDVMFAFGTARAVKLQVEAGNDQIYLYEYGYADEDSDYILHTNVRGATHCAQTMAVMDSRDEDKLSDAYKRVKVVMRDLWINFVTTGKPVPEGSLHTPWPPVGRNRTPFMFIDEELTLKNSFLEDRARLWDGVYEKYYRIPIPPFPY